MLLIVLFLILPRVHPVDLVFLFHLGIMMLAILFPLLPKFYLEGLAFLHNPKDLIVLNQVAPIKLEAQVILLLLVFNFLLEVNRKFGDNPKLGVIIQFTGNIHLDYKPNLGIFLSKAINNCPGGKILN
jgi:hypothetical protein